MPILGIVASSRLSAVAVGDYESIATVSVGSGGSSTITFSSIPSTYKHLQIRGIARSSTGGASDVSGLLRFNSDTATNYSWHRLYGYGTSPGADSGATQGYIIFRTILADGNLASCFSPSVTDILDYANTNKFKTIRSLSGYNANSVGSMFLNSGNWRSTAAVNSIDLTINAGNYMQYSHFALYGIKG